MSHSSETVVFLPLGVVTHRECMGGIAEAGGTFLEPSAISDVSKGRHEGKSRAALQTYYILTVP